MTIESWRPVVNWEGLYEVSDHGRVRTVARMVPRGKGTYRVPQRFRKTHKHEALGYVLVTLESKTERRTARCYVHHLVAEAFIGPRPAGAEMRHLNGDKTDNRATNLMWGTSTENSYDIVRHGRHFWANKTHCPQGHEYSPNNTVKYGDGRRRCLVCVRHQSRMRARARRARQRGHVSTS